MECLQAFGDWARTKSEDMDSDWFLFGGRAERPLMREYDGTLPNDRAEWGRTRSWVCHEGSGLQKLQLKEPNLKKYGNNSMFFGVGLGITPCDLILAFVITTRAQFFSICLGGTVSSIATNIDFHRPRNWRPSETHVYFLEIYFQGAGIGIGWNNSSIREPSNNSFGNSNKIGINFPVSLMLLLSLGKELGCRSK